MPDPGRSVGRGVWLVGALGVGASLYAAYLIGGREMLALGLVIAGVSAPAYFVSHAETERRATALHDALRELRREILDRLPRRD
jgi:hypothetical protein